MLVLHLALFLLPTVLCQSAFGRSIRVGSRQLDEVMLTAFSHTTCRVFGLRPQVSGEVPAGPVLIVANHISWLDIQLLHSVAAMSFVGKAEIADWPVAGFLARAGGTIFHRRGSHDSASNVSNRMVAALNEGRRVAIFPEGGILPGDDIKRFHARMFKVAIEAGCPVQPVMIRYTRRGAMDHGVTFFRGENFIVNIVRLMGRPGCRAELSFLEPMPVSDQPRKWLADTAQAGIEKAYAQPVVQS